VQPPPTRYAERPDGVNIAYQVVGDGPFDLLYAPGFISHLDLQWTEPNFSRFLARLASFARLILYDKPGTGLSDPIPHLPPLEERAGDMEVVLDAVGSEQASIFALSEGGPAAMLFAATRPARVRSLLLCGTFASAQDFPADTTEQFARLTAMFDNWGEGRALDVFAPSVTSDTRRRFYGTFERAAASPRMARALIDAVAQIDVGDALAAITVPTLVLHVTGDTAVPVAVGRSLADRIPEAKFVEIEGIDHAFWLSDPDTPAEIAERFFTGTVHQAEPDRALATVLFTDIVASTERAAELGDTAWRSVLERHDELVTRTVTDHGGRVVKHIGDGALSTFDGPARAVRCAEALCAAARELGVELRAGVHTGECELIGDDLGGLAVHIGARVGAKAEPGEVLVSGTVKDLVVGSQIRFSDRGEHELKGVPGTWRLYALGEERREAAREQPLDGPADHMRRSDRVAVALARRAPRMVRFGARMATRGT
jgi:class 3 adenylate cyclase